MAACGYKETLGGPRREVCLPLVSGHGRTEFQKPRDMSPLTAPKRTSETSSLNVWF